MSNWDEAITNLLGILDLAENELTLINEAQSSLKSQQDTQKERIQEVRADLMEMLLESGVMSEKHPLADILIKDGPIKVVQHDDADPEDLPIDLVRIKRAPDMGAIKKALVRGDQVPGYHLEAGPQQLQIKRRKNT